MPNGDIIPCGNKINSVVTILRKLPVERFSLDDWDSSHWRPWSLPAEISRNCGPPWRRTQQTPETGAVLAVGGTQKRFVRHDSVKTSPQSDSISHFTGRRMPSHLGWPHDDPCNTSRRFFRKTQLVIDFKTDQTMKKKPSKHAPKTAIAVAKKPKNKIAVRTDIPIEYVVPTEQKALFANHFTVQHENGVYHLMFFQINPPLVIGTHEQKAELLREIPNVQAVCTARIVVAEQLMPKIIGALLENHGTRQAAAAGELEVVDVSSISLKKLG